MSNIVDLIIDSLETLRLKIFDAEKSFHYVFQINDLKMFSELVAHDFGTLWNELENYYKTKLDKWELCEIGRLYGVPYEYITHLALSRRWDKLRNLCNSDCGYYGDIGVMMRLLLTLAIDVKELDSINDEDLKKCIKNKLQLLVEKVFDKNIQENEIIKSLSEFVFGELGYEQVPRHIRFPSILAEIFYIAPTDCLRDCGCRDRSECVGSRAPCFNSCDTMRRALDKDVNAVNELTKGLIDVLSQRREYAFLYYPQLISAVYDYVYGGVCIHDKESLKINPYDFNTLSKCYGYSWDFFRRAIIELQLPRTSRARFILLLLNLVIAKAELERGKRDEACAFIDLAAAHAFIGGIMYGNRKWESKFSNWARTLFIRSANELIILRQGLCRTKEEKTENAQENAQSLINQYQSIMEQRLLLLPLIQLYHYHVQTYLNED